jgi:hypothetical protein
MRLRFAITAILAAGACGILPATASPACREMPCASSIVVAQGQPLQLTGQQPAARISKPKPRHKATGPAALAPAPKTAAPAAASKETMQAASVGDDARRVVVVRTTREPGDLDAPLASNGFNDAGHANVPASLVVSTITTYLGSPDARDDFDADAPARVQDLPAEARDAFASEAPPPEPAHVALEFMLMTFGGALAAAAAIRIFVI